MTEVLRILAQNKVYLGLCGCLTTLFFVVTGIQFWLPEYLTNVIVHDPDDVAVYITIMMLSSPISGVAVGGLVTSYCGGYNKRNGQKVQLVFGGMAVLFILPIPFLSHGEFVAAAMCFWFLLFFGGAILPQVTGIMLNSVNPSQRT